MSTNNEKKVTITDLHFSHTEQQNYDQYADIEIAGCPEHNARVRERRVERLYQTENALTRQQLQAINDSLQKQIDDAKKSAKTSTIISGVSICVSIISIAVSIFLSIFL